MEDRFKFRAYFIPEEYYVKITQLNFDAEGNITEIKFIKPKSVAPGGSEYICYQDQLNKFVFEQCTGLKDKNGKLIYEGDIVSVPEFYNDIPTGKTRRHKVSYKHAAFNIYSVNTEHLEVIGNIHENSELLEE